MAGSISEWPVTHPKSQVASPVVSVIHLFTITQGMGVLGLHPAVGCNRCMIQPLEILSYDPGWALEFQAEREGIARVLGKIALRTEHIGSTAVPGLAAKPVIDIQVSVECLQPIRAYADPLATVGYVHVPHADDRFCPFFHRPREWPHTHHLHVVEFGGKEERRTLAFRDFLREHTDVAQKYTMLKMQLAAVTDATNPSAREAYASAKSEFVNRVVQIALQAGYPRGL